MVGSEQITIRKISGDLKTLRKGSEPAAEAAVQSVPGYSLMEMISENTGEASLYKAMKDGKIVVLKLYHPGKRPEAGLISRLKEVHSPYVIRPAGQGEQDGVFYEELPFFPAGDLTKHMPFSAKDLEQMVIPSVNEGLHALHEANILHRDIKPSNLFLDGDKTVIGDFGISSAVHGDKTVFSADTGRTLGYSAPECSAGFISRESDYYSFGITLWKLLIGKDPFEGMNEMQILYFTMNKKVELPQTIPLRMRNLIEGLTRKDRNSRWGYEQVVKWLNGEELETEREIPEEQSYGKKGCAFRGKIFDSMPALALELSLFWEEAKHHVFNISFIGELSEVDGELGAFCQNLTYLKNQDLALFRLLSVLDPQGKIKYKGNQYESLEEIGRRIDKAYPAVIPEFMEMLCNRCFTDYLETKGYDSTLIRAVEEAAEQCRRGEKEYYYSLIYLFRPNMGYERFLSLEQFAEYFLTLSENEAEEFSEKLLRDQKFFMWLYAEGFEKQLEHWKKIMEKAEWQ